MNETIRNRHTLKVLADPSCPWAPPDSDFDDVIIELLDLAACGPYHYPCHPTHQLGKLNSPAPWRFYASNGSNTRELLKRIPNLDIPLGKVGSMLAAADGLVLVTWLPDPPHGGPAELQSYEATHRNMEHIAATAAAIQNLLLAATDAGLNNYWSSGGVLRTEAVYEWLEIPKNQVLLGAIFLFPQETKAAETKPGVNRHKKGNRERWMKWISLDSAN